MTMDLVVQCVNQYSSMLLNCLYIIVLNLTVFAVLFVEMQVEKILLKIAKLALNANGPNASHFSKREKYI